MPLDHDTQDAILTHLREIGVVKRAMLQTAMEIAGEFPTQSAVLLSAIKELTNSAHVLLGDTVVSGPPSGLDP